ncbi:TGF-beta receptor type-1 [Hypsibius exemplaris]|uniref:receptor protein serine/threonine kinase n=1 Tax=Hypsibius exemplaris TaxID=2072580 RepID=A0A1W0X3H8_HYPEX|nr:TGF-beta receptor type-1 [Hypsibius exemplaris]
MALTSVLHYSLTSILVLSFFDLSTAIKAAGTAGLTCFCESCLNQTCFTDGVCITQLARQADGRIQQSHSCLAKHQLFPEENPLLCVPNLRHRETNALACCSDYNFCNRDANISLWDIPQIADATGVAVGGLQGLHLYLVIGVSVVVGLLVIGLISAVWYFRRRHELMLKSNSMKDEAVRLLEEARLENHLSLLGEYTTSGSGSGCPLLIQRTIARQVTLVNIIGKGRYGEVYLGRWHGENVAVKMFSTRDEDSWKREVEIYQTVMLRHENLLGFIAADNKDNGLTTQLWLITDYHELGSLFDFLTSTSIDVPAMLRLVFSLANGLAHLHMDILGTSDRSKPAIAHRDLKSKNVLVKRNGQCVIADLGLAVRYEGKTGILDIPANEKFGTIRYLAPEVLDGNLNLKNFESLKAVDIYALALVMWEICHRCQFYGSAEDFELPYAHDVPSEPDMGQMREAVCVQKKRPTLPNRWSSREPMITMTRLMRECWYSSSQARLTALRVRKTIATLMATADVKL